MFIKRGSIERVRTLNKKADVKEVLKDVEVVEEVKEEKEEKKKTRKLKKNK